MLSRAAMRSAAGLLRRNAARTLPLPTLARCDLPAIYRQGMAWNHDIPSQPSNSGARNLSTEKQDQQARNASSPPPPPSTDTESSSRHAELAREDSKSRRIESEDGMPDLSKLPDLTQGIPSTLEYEAGGNRSALSRTEEEATASSGGGRAKGELPASAYVTSNERRRLKMANWLYAVAAGTIVGGTIYLGRDWDAAELGAHPDQPNGWGPRLWWNRAMARLTDAMSYYQEPSYPKLLPDHDPTWQAPYTLCLGLEGLLVHSEWSRDHGWRIAKRPGLDYFLLYLSQYYELVLFTTAPQFTVEQVMRKLDPYHLVPYMLCKEATRFKNGELVKDLSYINRDLSKVIILDTKPEHVREQAENAIVIPRWNGEKDDKDLVALIPFLEYIAAMEHGDVRRVLKSFEGKNIPTEFARREALARIEYQKHAEAEKRRGGGGGVGLLGSLTGIKPNNVSLMVNPDEEAKHEGLVKGKMLQDIMRERGQRNYEAMLDNIRQNGEKMLKEEAAFMEQQQKEAMRTMKSSFGSWFGIRPARDEEEKSMEDTKNTKGSLGSWFGSKSEQ